MYNAIPHGHSLTYQFPSTLTWHTVFFALCKRDAVCYLKGLLSATLSTVLPAMVGAPKGYDILCSPMGKSATQLLQQLWLSVVTTFLCG